LLKIKLGIAACKLCAALLDQIGFRRGYLFQDKSESLKNGAITNLVKLIYVQPLNFYDFK